MMNPGPSTDSSRTNRSLPPSRSRRIVALSGGGLAGFGFGVLLLTVLTLFLTVVTQGLVVAIFFYGGMLYMIPISLTFLVVMTSIGSAKALREYDAGGNRLPTLATSGFYGVILVGALIVSILISLRIVDKREQTTQANLLQQRYGDLYYPHSVSNPDHSEQMRTSDSYQKVTGFYQHLPGCDTTKVQSGGGTFIIPCHTTGDPAAKVYLRVCSRVANNEPYLTIDTTSRLEW